MKISVMVPKSELSTAQQNRLSRLGNTSYTRSREEYPLDELISFCQGSEVLAFDPDNIGGFEAAPLRLTRLCDSLPHLKGIALVTTSYGYVDLDYCKKRGLIVTNVPYYATEAVAEHTLAFLLGTAKRIFAIDRKTQRGAYSLVEGFELFGKTLGIIGLGHIGSRVARLGSAIGMEVVAWNRSEKKLPNVRLLALDQVLALSHFVSVHVAHCDETIGLISTERVQILRKGAVVVNTADRSIVDEEAMAIALKSGAVDSYVLEADDITSPPLGNVENAFLFKGFGWYTKEALMRNYDVWIDNIESIIKGAPINAITA